MERAEIVLKAASELFSQYGIKSVSMDQIARKAGVSKKSIYENFADKEELLTGMVTLSLDAGREFFREVIASGENPILKIARIYEFLLQQQRNFHPSLYRTMSRSYQKSLSVVDEYQREVSYTLLPSLLAEARKQKIIHERVDIQLVCELYHWFLQRLVTGDLYELLNRDYKAMVEHIVVYNLRGLLNKEYAGLLDDFVVRK